METLQPKSESREKISAFVISFNEEADIARCLKSLDFCDEVLVIDSFSTDRTVSIAEGLGARVLQRKWPGYVAQKAFGLENCTHEWVLNVDADEEVSPELRASILAVLSSAAVAESAVYAGYEINRLVYYFNRWWRNGGWYPEYRLRFLRKSLTVWGGSDPHEKPTVRGQVGRLEGDLYHYTYASLDDQVQQLSRFASLGAKTYYDKGKRASVVSMTVAPLVRFFKFYVVKRGYREGVVGFIVAMLEGYYTFLKYARLWEEDYLNKRKNIGEKK